MNALCGENDAPDSLRAARLELRMSQEQIAAALQVRQSEVSAWERGRRPVRATRSRLALFLRQPVEVVDGWWPRRQRGKAAA